MEAVQDIDKQIAVGGWKAGREVVNIRETIRRSEVSSRATVETGRDCDQSLLAADGDVRTPKQRNMEPANERWGERPREPLREPRNTQTGSRGRSPHHPYVSCYNR
jgi:hypothetical protein